MCVADTAKLTKSLTRAVIGGLSPAADAKKLPIELANLVVKCAKFNKVCSNDSNCFLILLLGVFCLFVFWSGSYLLLRTETHECMFGNSV